MDASIRVGAYHGQLLQLGCAYSGQVFSFQKMIGHLQDAGSVTIL